MCFMASPAGASSRSTKNTWGTRIWSAYAQARCNRAAYHGDPASTAQPRPRTCLFLKNLGLRVHGAHDTHLRNRRPHERAASGPAVQVSSAELCSCTEAGGESSQQRHDGEGTTAQPCCLRGERARTVVGSRISAFIPAPHSASMRRMYALTAPFSPSLRAGVAIATLSSVTGRS